MAPPTSTITASFPAGQSATFSVFLTSQGTPINGGTVTVLVQDTHGATVAQTSVTVQTQ
jgi:hypothetical protein